MRCLQALVDGRGLAARNLGGEDVDEELLVAGVLALGVANERVELAMDAGHLEQSRMGQDELVDEGCVVLLLQGRAPVMAS